MRKFTFLLFILSVINCSSIFGQICDPTTPVLTANLTGNPDSLWISPPIIRDGHCCGVTGNDRCLEIILTLDAGSQGIVFNVYSGAMPSGALYYQVNCGPMTPVGTQLCLSGVGPHILTFCKPGNNDNQFSIQAIPAPGLPNALTLNDGCTGTLTTTGFTPGTINWTSIAPGAPGQYNNYLSSTTSSTINVQAQPGYPPYVDYQVCGVPTGGCYTQPVCLTTRVTFNPTLFASVTPLNPTVCFGSAGTTITAQGSGGSPPYSYQWSNGATTQSIFVGPGTYSVIIHDNTDCPPTTANVTVTQFNSAITANAGPDKIICIASPSVTLNGSVTAVTTGVWSGGNGTYNPGNTSLNTTYFPTQAEINAGFVNLTLTTTGNGTCPAQSDMMHVDILPFQGTPSATGSSVSCFGSTNGTASASVTGTTTPYTYSWTTSPPQFGATASGLAPGTYTVSITDGNGCPTRTTAIITQPQPLTSTTVKTNTSCYLGSNGTATVTAYGGTTPYTYTWTPGGATTPTANNLAAGTYTYTVTDANGCKSTSTVIITQPSILTTTIINKVNVSCFGGSNGSATVSASGGTPGYTYSWSPSGGNNVTATGLIAGSYFITVTDANGCQAIANTNITQPAQALTATTTQVNVSCKNGTNGSATATPSGGTGPYTYSWSSGATTATANNLAAGTFNLTVTDNKGCTYSTTVTITEPLILATTISGTTSVSCFGGSNGTATVSASGGTTPYTYTWNGTGNTSATTSGLAAGTYTALVTDNNGCTSTTTAIITQPAAALASTTSQTNVSCNNGSNGTADVNVTGGTAPYTYSWTPSGGSSPNASGLAAGTYTITVTDSKGCTITPSVIITQPPVLGVTTLTTNVSCNGGSNGSVTASVSGGTLPYTYSWSGSASTTATASNLIAGSYNVTVTDANGCTASITSTITQPVILSGTTTSTNATIFGVSNGTASVTAAGGTTPYTYSWTPSGGTAPTANGLAAGTYSVTVTDANGCLIVLPVIITQPDPLIVTTTQVNVLCNGGNNGSISATVSGGTTPFTYSWSPGGATTSTITALTAGTYTISVTDANGGVAGTSTIITQPTALTSSATPQGVSCFNGSNGSATVTASGGTTPYTYSWTPGGSTAATATGLIAGTYTASVSDANGCLSQSVAIITQPSAPLAAVITTTPVSCKNGSNGTASAAVTGGTAPYTYSWSGGTSTTSSITGLPAGTYSLQVTDSKGCIVIESFTISEPTQLVTTTNVINTLCGLANGQANVQVSGGVGAYTYSWSPSGGTAATATNLLAGTYYVTVTDANGCSIQDTAIIINNTPAINVTTVQTNVSCFGGNNGTADATVIGGQSPYTYSWTSGSTTPATSGLIAGTYTISITDANTCYAITSVQITQPAAPLTASTSVINHVSCNGGNDGSASVTASGGTAPYTYSWSPLGGTGTTANGLSANSYSILITDSKGCTFTATVTINQPTLLTTSTSQVNVSCFTGNNGTATVTASGGTTPYTYSWNNGNTTPSINTLIAGTYSVTVTDSKGCQSSQSVIITEPALLTTTLTATNVLCYSESNGSASSTVNGGTAPYTYSWSPSGGTGPIASSLTAGTYTVSVTDSKGCQSTASIAITEPQILAGTVTKSNVNCFAGNDGSASIAVTGGTTPYTYAWTPSGATTATSSSLATGSYTVTVSDANGCNISTQVFISQPAAPLSSTGTQTNVSCFGGSDGTASVTISGGTTPYTYSWAPSGGTGPSASSLAAGTYTASVTDANGCQYQHPVIITQPPLLVASKGNVTNVKCFGGSDGSVSSTVSGGTSPYTYAWSPSGGTNPSATGLAAGTYTLTVTDSKGCSDTTTAVVKEPLAPLSATTSQTNILCFGDTTGIANVVPAGGTAPYTVTWFPFGGSLFTADSLTAGNYTATINDTNNCQITRSFTITQNAAMVVTITETDATCGASNGSATVSVTGGTSPYTYSWNTTPPSTSATITNLASTNYDVLVTDANGCQQEDMALVDNIAGPTATIYSITNVSCFGGSNGTATVTQSGGIPPYHYLWSNGDTTPTADSLHAGIHVVTVIDQNNCQGLTATNPQISQPPQVFFQFTKTDVNCFGGSDGSASLNVSGGVPPYTYSWSPSGGTGSSATNLTAGTYVVTILDANGCDTSGTVTIVQPPLLSSSLTSSNVSCFGGNDGTATITAAGGTSPYTYNWLPAGGTSSNATDLTAGTYTVDITDAHGCTTQSTAIITQPTTGLSATTGQVNVSCFGGNDGSAGVITSGGTSPYTYSWSPVVSANDTAFNLTQGVYTATITDTKGCSISKSVTITEPPLLNVVITSSSNVSCFGGNNGSASASVSGGTGPYTYSWSPSGGTAPVSSAFTAGTYSLIVTDAKGCSTSDTIIITQPLAPLAATTTTQDVLCNAGNSGSATVAVTGGTTPYSYQWSPSGGSGATASSLTAGVYTVLVTDSNACTTTASATINEPLVLTATISASSDVSCNAGNNGSATVTAAGGTVPYSYLWSNNDVTATTSNLTAATYSVVVTDNNGCQASTSVIINQPALLEATTSQTEVSCFNGSDGAASVNASGGTTPYTYSWSTGAATPAINTLTAGSYTVDITDANGCTLQKTVVITEPSLLSASLTKTDVSCFGQTDGTATSIVSGGTSPYTYSWSPAGGTFPNASSLAAGTYTLHVTDAMGCTTTASTIITQPALLTSNATSTNVSCFGGNDGTATVTVAGGTTFYTYNWSPSGGTSSSATGLTAGTYTVDITDAHGCTTQSTAIITQPATGLSATTGQVNVSCFGGNDGSAGVITSGGTSPYTYSWSPVVSANDTAFNLTQGVYNVEVKDNKGCTITETVTISEPTELLAGTSNIINTFCAQINGEVTATATGGTGPYTYSWSTGSSSPTITGLTSGTYTITITDSKGCQDTSIAIITDTPGGTADITSTTHVSCYGGNNGTSTVTPSGGIPPYTFSWAPSGGNGPTGVNMIAGFYTVSVTDSKGCIATDTVTIKEPPLLRVEIDTIIGASCSGYSDGYAVALPTGGTLPYSYSWTTVPPQTNDTATNLATGIYFVIVTDSLGCTATINANVMEPSPLTSQISTSHDVTCYAKGDGTATVFAAGGTAPFNYSWSSSPSQTSATATNLVPGIYSVDVTDAKGCLSTSTVTITQPDPLITTAVGPDSVCLGQSIVLVASATGGNGGYFYQWTPNLGMANPVTVNPTAPITYYVTAFDSLGCQGTRDTLTVDVISLSPADISLTGESPICPGASTTLTATINSTSTGTLTYNWNNGLSNQQSITTTPSQPTTYILQVTNSCGATVTDSIDVDFIQLPVVTVIPDKDNGCSPLTIAFTDQLSGSTETATAWQWNFGDGASSSDENPTHVFENTGTYQVSVTITTSSGCQQTSALSSPVTVHPDPVAEFTATPTYVFIPRGNVNVSNTSTGAITYEWDFGDGSTSDLETPPPHKYQAIGTYPILLTATNEHGCIDTTIHTVVATGEIKFPTAFTPNQDGPSGGAYDPRNMTNDVFFPRHSGVSEYHLMIFNRWGELIFESFDVNIGWDGYYRGKLCKQDVYVWKAYAKLNDGRVYSSVGDVTLLR